MDAGTRGVVVAALAGVLLAGCMSRENTRLTLARDVSLPAIEEEAALRTGAIESFEHRGPVDRSTWREATFLVPVDGTSHGALAVEDLALSRTTARQRRAFPTADEAVVLNGEGSNRAQAVEGLVAPLWNIWQLVAAVPRMFIETADGDNVSPRDSYERLWSADPDRFVPPAPVEGGGDG